MTMPIGPVSTGAVSATDAGRSSGTTLGKPSDTPGPFGESLNALLASVDESAGLANSAVGNMMDGTGDVHQAMIALQRAENSLELTVQVRNKLVQAYQDVMRMTI